MIRHSHRQLFISRVARETWSKDGCRSYLRGESETFLPPSHIGRARLRK
jgi:hypothetical protein